MIKVVQFGEGNFLRTFADVYFDALCEEGGEYEVNIVKPIPQGSLDAFREQNNRYGVVLRGIEKGEAVEKPRKISVVKSVVSPFEQEKEYYALARDPELKIIVSNTTEAGICFCETDKRGDLAHMTFPAKLTLFLYERFRAGQGGVYMLPVELIDDNADALAACVKKYIELWALPAAFAEWNERENLYCNTLVDRIVSGRPRDEETLARLEKLLGGGDKLLSVGEPFGLWAIEDKGNVSEYIKAGVHNIEVVLASDITYYKKRKVRVLNGSHTNLVAAGLILGKETVYDCMTDPVTSAFFERSLTEIVPFVSDDTVATWRFAGDVKERFLNPFLNHRLTGIALNSISKWRARCLPTFKDFYAAHGRLAPEFTVGFSYLMALYSSAESADGGYVAKLGGRTIPLSDDEKYLAFFAGGGKAEDFMRDESVWGEDLAAYKGFVSAVSENIAAIKRGENLLARPEENPIATMVPDGGMTAIFRKIGFVGDSLSSGEVQIRDPKDPTKWKYIDMYEYSWGQFIARKCGITAFNVSRGGASAKSIDSLAGNLCAFYPRNACKAYVVALGVNDITSIMNDNGRLYSAGFGSMDDVNFADRSDYKDSVVGWYNKLLLNLRACAPDSPIFVLTIPRADTESEELKAWRDKHAEMLRALPRYYKKLYVIDLRKYAPVYDGEIRSKYFLNGHMSPMGYKYTADMVATYIDYIVTHYPADFRDVQLIGEQIEW